ncbi:MAG TPA: hypothetical protein VN934_10185 [Candidatus Tumulicola sp.]|nr:hypothetical protein [Candidatus Tumulicola sp.]
MRGPAWIVTAALGAALVISATGAVTPPMKSAPADEYFGRQKLSYLGINNTFRDQAVRAGAHTTLGMIITPVGAADEALHDWEQKYPNDPQLSRSYYLGTLAFRKIWTKEFQDKAWDYMHIIVRRFPKSFFAKQVRADIARGFTEHYYAEALPCPSPTPPPTQPQFPPPTFGPRQPRATPTPSPSPSPAPTPSPTPTPTPAPGQPNLDILTPDCVPPATPTPIPTFTPTTAPSPLLPVPTLAPPTPHASPTAATQLSPPPAPAITPTPAPSPLLPVPTLAPPTPHPSPTRT